MRPDRAHRRIVYILGQFPADTLNFVYNEIACLEDAGFTVDIHSLLESRDCPEEARRFAERTNVLSPISPLAMLRAWTHYLCTRPIALMSLLVHLPLDNSEHRIRKAVKTLAHMAVGVYFAWLQRNNPDHVHAHFAFKGCTAALIAARLNRTTFSFTAHGSATVNPPNRYGLRSKTRAASFVVAVSEFNRSVLLALCPDVAAEKIEVNRTGVLLTEFPYAERPPHTLDREFTLICVASLVPVKNHAGLLKACCILAERQVPFRLHLVGKDRNGLGAGLAAFAEREKIADRVVFHGMVDHGRIAKMLDTADACILTSWSEGIPVSLMEAMARGVPVIGPHVTGVPELLEHGRTGFLADPHDPGSFADAVETLYRDPVRAREMARAARDTVESKYDMAANASRLARIFHRRLG